MTAFLVAAVVMTALALAWVLPPLLRRRPSGGVERAASNLALLREQLSELDADLKSGTLSSEQYAKARAEVERRVLEEAESERHGADSGGRGGQWAAAVLAALIPISAALLYLQLGSPGALSSQRPVTGDHGLTMEQIADLVERLAARMKENPDDLKGWVMLGRSYAVLDRFPEAAAAYANALKRSPPDAQLLADYADALAMAQGRRLFGEPERLIAQALQVDPDNVKALALAGTVAFEKKDFKGAIAHWERILKVVPPDSEMADSVRGSIADARSAAGGSVPAPAPAPAPALPSQPAAAAAQASVSGTVRLAPAVSSGASPTDTVFIFARAVNGPRAPLAVTRRQVRDLPATFALDDSMAMTPEMRLSKHERVVVGARVSKSGNPVPQPGDWEGLSAPVRVGADGVVVVIDREVGAPK